ncbi:MAG: NUDIX domain-containing protein [Breznakia sp.]
MLIAILEDTAFRKRGRDPYMKRWTVRAFTYDTDGKLLFLRIKGHDSLGKRDHLETIGGGVENEESLRDAMQREVREEIGYECEIVEEIGYVVDHYNALNRETISTYFVVKLGKYVGGESRSLTEKELIYKIEQICEEEVVEELLNAKAKTVNELVQRRDRIAFEYYLEKKGKKTDLD